MYAVLKNKNKILPHAYYLGTKGILCYIYIYMHQLAGLTYNSTAGTAYLYYDRIFLIYLACYIFLLVKLLLQFIQLYGFHKFMRST